MSCSNCNITHTSNQCYEARLSIGLKNDNSAIIGSLDGISFKPIYLKPAVQKNETNTTLKYDPTLRSLIFENENFKKGQGSANFISSQAILAGALISELGGVGPLTEGGLATVIRDGADLLLDFTIPPPIEVGEVASGFITYVNSPNPGTGHYKTIQPDTSGSSDTLLVGHPDGSIEFAVPITSPILIPTAGLTSGGAFNGTPAVSSGSWRYQEMGTSGVIQNTSRSTVEVTLRFRYSMQAAGSRSGVYATLVNGGSDYKTTFVEGIANVKQEGYPGGIGLFNVILSPNQKCQFKFGFWTNASGTLVGTIGSTNETGGSAVETPYPPIITVRRLV